MEGYDAWPPKQAKPAALYLGANGQLSFTQPAAQPAAGAEFDEYISDPAKPVPFTTATEIGMTREHMTDDQRQRWPPYRRARLPDRPAPGRRDHRRTDQAGLFVSTSGTDSDFVVKLIDVYPDDYPDNEGNPKDVTWEITSSSFVANLPRPLPQQL